MNTELDRQAIELCIARREHDIARDLILARQRIDRLKTVCVVLYVLGLISGVMLRSL